MNVQKLTPCVCERQTGRQRGWERQKERNRRDLQKKKLWFWHFLFPFSQTFRNFCHNWKGFKLYRDIWLKLFFGVLGRILTPSDGEDLFLEIWGVWSTSSLPGPLLSVVVVLVGKPSTDQVDLLENYSYSIRQCVKNSSETTTQKICMWKYKKRDCLNLKRK